MRRVFAAVAALTLASIGAASGAAAGEDLRSVTLTLKDHRFTPDTIQVPAGQRVRVDLVNLDPATEEFDSVDLRVEQDVSPRGRTSFVIGPLTPGTYSFMGELHADTASGTIRAVGER